MWMTPQMFVMLLVKKKDAKGGWTPGIRYIGREIIFEQS